MTKIEQKIKKATERNCVYAGAYMLEEAYNACNPENDHHWRGAAVRFVADNTVEIGSVHWDFENVDGVEEIEDAEYLPWDVEGYAEFIPEDVYNLNDAEEFESFLEQIGEWV